jgi:hypothetical protein
MTEDPKLSWITGLMLCRRVKINRANADILLEQAHRFARLLSGSCPEQVRVRIAMERSQPFDTVSFRDPGRIGSGLEPHQQLQALGRNLRAHARRRAGRYQVLTRLLCRVGARVALTTASRQEQDQERSSNAALDRRR